MVALRAATCACVSVLYEWCASDNSLLNLLIMKHWWQCHSPHTLVHKHSLLQQSPSQALEQLSSKINHTNGFCRSRHEHPKRQHLQNAYPLLKIHSEHARTAHKTTRSSPSRNQPRRTIGEPRRHNQTGTRCIPQEKHVNT